MKIEKINTNSYRVRKTYKGKTYSLMFDHRPVQREVIEEFQRKINYVKSDNFKECALSYMEVKQNVLSVSTIKGYSSLLNNAISERFLLLPINDITQVDIQMEINNYAAGHSPKTVRNLHGFISSVFSMFRPDMIIHTTLPQKRKFESYLPTPQDISAILNASKEDKFYSVAFQLGCLGMRRSEICALTLKDLKGNTLTINKALVSDVNNEWIVKSTKTTSGEREIFLPDGLIKQVKEQGYFYNGYPNTILLGLHAYQDKLGIPQFRFHDLRHYYASYCHSMGIPDAVIIKNCGWSQSGYAMKNVYRHAMKNQLEESQMEVANKILT